FSACLGQFLTFYALVAVFPNLPWKDAIRLALFTELVAAILWRVWLFERIKRDEDRQQSPPPARKAD
ncbi:MAG TPA: hypothetical protein VIQ30_10480, partial [Pseudonocardia sp.]